MDWLWRYRAALRAASDATSRDVLAELLEKGGTEFADFVRRLGLAPLWQIRTGLAVFREDRMQAEALYAVQSGALREIDACMDRAGIQYVVMKGAANREVLYQNPAIRLCSDIDLLVHAPDRVGAAEALMREGYRLHESAENISHEITLVKSAIQVDLHWRVLRVGRLRTDPTAEMLHRRRRVRDLWMLSAEDALFLLLVHPAFAKHVTGSGLGLHRVVDILEWPGKQGTDCNVVLGLIEQRGVKTAAWAVLRWVDHLQQLPGATPLASLLTALEPGFLRRKYLDLWVQNNLPDQLSSYHWLRLAGFSMLLHDRPSDVLRALLARKNAAAQSQDELAMFKRVDDR